MRKLLLVLLVLSSTTLIYAQWTNGQAADLVLGQPNLTTKTADNGTPSGVQADALDGCSGIAIDLVNGKMYVADEDNSRVLRYAYPITSNQQAAEAVFGQPNFTSSSSNTTQSRMTRPRGIAIHNNTLWVADNSNNRVLRFDDAATKTYGANADGVLGQSNFTSNSSATTQSGMNAPYDIAVDNSGTLWVADGINNRVLRFDDAANKTNGANADGVLGQSNFTSNSTAISQSGMNAPYGIAVDNSGTLWVADGFNNRVLRFDDAANKTNGADADGVLGQSNFTSKFSATTQSGMNQPMDVAVDNNGRLYVAENSNNRVLIFDDAANKSNGANADNVLGQANFTSSGTGITASTMDGGYRSSVAVDNTNNLLWVSDTDNNRVIRFTASSALPVELTYFKGQATATGSLLQWQTATEKNNEGFDIQRSTDGREWETIGFVQGHGTTQEVQNYTYTDEAPLAGTNYYRLKQVDFDGAFEYSDIVHITMKASNNNEVAIFPNPVSDELNIVNGEGVATIYNALGQPVKELIINNLQSTINVKDLPKGQYILRITQQNGNVVSQQFVK